MNVISVGEHLAALVNVEVQARDKERERIIKLLEATEALHLFKFVDGKEHTADWTMEHKSVLCSTCQAIALIKGEIK